jgi:DNA-binding GntR family transcriptional regulator
MSVLQIDLSQRDSLSALVYNQVRDEIMNGLWKPGSRLTIRGQAERFNISSTPVREAMLQLASEKALLLETRSFSIPILTEKEFLEIRKIRVALERLLVEEAITGPDRKLAEELFALHEKLIAAKAERDFRTVMIQNQRFHFQLYERANMPETVAIVRSLWTRSGPYQHSLYLRHPPIEPEKHDHLRVCAAVRSGDAFAAAQAVVDDITLRGVRIQDQHYSTFYDALRPIDPAQ